MAKIQEASTQLARFEAGERVSKIELQQLMGELKANTAVIDVALERGDETTRMFDKVMPLSVKKARSERRRAKIWAVILELFNEATDVAFLFELWSSWDLFYASLTFMLITVLGRLLIGLSLWRRVEEGKQGQYLRALLVNLVEPNTGQTLLKATLEDHETSGQVWNTKLRKYVASDKDPVAVMAHNDWTAGWAEITTILIMVFCEDIPEFIIELIFLTRKKGSVDLIWWLSTVGTFLHLVLQLSELWITWWSLGEVHKLMEGRDKMFDPESTNDETLAYFSQVYKQHVQRVNLRGCKKVTNKGIKSLATSCPGLQAIDVTGTAVTDEGVETLAASCERLQEFIIYAGKSAQVPYGNKFPQVGDKGAKALAVNCPHLQIVYFSHCAELTDDGVQTLATKCRGLRKVAFEHCKAVTDEGVKALAANCSGLNAVYFTECKVTDDGAQALAMKCSGLKAAYFGDCNGLTDKGVEALATACPGLHTAVFFNTRITDKGVKCMAANCSSLQMASLQNCKGVTDMGAKALATKCPFLDELYLNGTAVSEANRRQLRSNTEVRGLLSGATADISFI
eukprot:g479.t1